MRFAQTVRLSKLLQLDSMMAQAMGVSVPADEASLTVSGYVPKAAQQGACISTYIFCHIALECCYAYFGNVLFHRFQLDSCLQSVCCQGREPWPGYACFCFVHIVDLINCSHRGAPEANLWSAPKWRSGRPSFSSHLSAEAKCPVTSRKMCSSEFAAPLPEFEFTHGACLNNSRKWLIKEAHVSIKFSRIFVLSKFVIVEASVRLTLASTMGSRSFVQKFTEAGNRKGMSIATPLIREHVDVSVGDVSVIFSKLSHVIISSTAVTNLFHELEPYRRTRTCRKRSRRPRRLAARMCSL